METIDRLPDTPATIGAREIAKGIAAGTIKRVVVAANCPEFLLAKVSGATVVRFAGNQKELGTKLGKPFPAAMAGYKE